MGGGKRDGVGGRKRGRGRFYSLFEKANPNAALVQLLISRVGRNAICLPRGEVTPALSFELSKLPGFVCAGGVNAVRGVRPGDGL